MTVKSVDSRGDTPPLDEEMKWRMFAVQQDYAARATVRLGRGHQ